VDVEEPVPLRLVELEGGLPLEEAGVVDEDVEATEGGEGGGGDARAGAGVAEVRGVPGGAAPEPLDRRDDAPSRVGVPAVDEDVGALRGEGQGDRPPDAPRGPGDDGRLAGEPHRATAQSGRGGALLLPRTPPRVQPPDWFTRSQSGRGGAARGRA